MTRARDNPFRVQRITALEYRLPRGTSWEGLLARFHHLGRRAALVGEHGRGKSTLLRELADRLAEGGFRPRFVHLGRGQRRLARDQEELLFRDPGARDLWLVDGADHLGWWSWRRIASRSRRAAGLLVTSHRPLGGLSPLLHCASSTELLRELIGELAPGPLPASWPSPEDLFARHGGNIREAFWELYAVGSWSAGCEEPGRSLRE